jgi:hypothetical protein
MVLQHFLGKEKVPGSSPGVGSNSVQHRITEARNPSRSAITDAIVDQGDDFGCPLGSSSQA